MFYLMNNDSGAEGEYIPLPGNDCAAPEQDGCCWQAGGIYTGVCFVKINHGSSVQIGQWLNLFLLCRLSHCLHG